MSLEKDSVLFCCCSQFQLKILKSSKAQIIPKHLQKEFI